VLEVYVSKRRDRKSALKFLKKIMKRYGRPQEIVTDRLKSYRAAMKIIGNAEVQEIGRWKNNRCKTPTYQFHDESRRCCNSSACEVCKNSSPSTHQSITTSTMNAI